MSEMMKMDNVKKVIVKSEIHGRVATETRKVTERK